MKILLTAVIFVLIMAVPAMALECPDDSLKVIKEEGTDYSFSFTCDDGKEIFNLVIAQGSSVEKLVEFLTDKKCVQHNNQSGEMRSLHCR